MDAAESELDGEQVTAAEYDIFFGEVEEEIFWEELHERHSADLAPTFSAVPAFQHTFTCRPKAFKHILESFGTFRYKTTQNPNHKDSLACRVEQGGGSQGAGGAH